MNIIKILLFLVSFDIVATAAADVGNNALAPGAENERENRRKSQLTCLSHVSSLANRMVTSILKTVPSKASTVPLTLGAASTSSATMEDAEPHTLPATAQATIASPVTTMTTVAIRFVVLTALTGSATSAGVIVAAGRARTRRTAAAPTIASEENVLAASQLVAKAAIVMATAVVPWCATGMESVLQLAETRENPATRIPTAASHHLKVKNILNACSASAMYIVMGRTTAVPAMPNVAMSSFAEPVQFVSPHVCRMKVLVAPTAHAALAIAAATGSVLHRAEKNRQLAAAILIAVTISSVPKEVVPSVWIEAMFARLIRNAAKQQFAPSDGVVRPSLASECFIAGFFPSYF